MRGTAVSAEVRVSPSIGETASIARGSDGVWDPDDAQGRFDIRWVGAAYTSAGHIHLTVSSYDALRLRRLPKEVPTTATCRFIGAHWKAIFLRQPGGRVIFEWPDFGSCCRPKIADVTRPAPKVFSVTFNPCAHQYGEEIHEASADTYWRTHNIRARDRTGATKIGHPNCDEDRAIHASDGASSPSLTRNFGDSDRTARRTGHCGRCRAECCGIPSARATEGK